MTLRVALVHRDHPRLLEDRMIGMWSYDVPEFLVTRYPMHKPCVIDRDALDRQHDVIVIEDSRMDWTLKGSASIPVCYTVQDSTLSDAHYHHRLQQSKQADLLLVDWDRIDRFDDGQRAIYRLNYSVNERFFKPVPKTLDVGFFVAPSPDRQELFRWLQQFCEERGYSFEGGMRSGAQYAECMASARVNVHLGRNAATRAHRCYDVMACQSCLLTSPMPVVSGEFWKAGREFVEWHNHDQLARSLDHLLTGEAWRYYAHNGYDYVMGGHTWRHRAAELHEILCYVFPELWRRACALH